MLYYYKRPGDWLWRRLNTTSIAAAADERRVATDWRYRMEGDATDRTLAELIEIEETAERHSPSQPVDESVFAPDGTWGYITVVGATALLLFVFLVPSQPHSLSTSCIWRVLHSSC